MTRARAHNHRRKSHRRSRRNRQAMLGGGAALAVALASVWSVAAFNGVDVAAAAAAKAQSIADLMSRRSPGERTEAHLNKTKHKHFAVLAEREQPEAAPILPVPLAPATLPASIVPDLLPVAAPALAASAPPLPAFFPTPGGAVFFSPPPGVGGGPGGGGGVVTPPNQPPPNQPPPNQPPQTGAVPEPGTWAMMIFGFGFTGLALRRRRVAATAALAQ